MRTIGIVGAGFCGTATAIALLRKLKRGPVRVVLIEPLAEVGSGLAYETRDSAYLLNVPASQMSVDAEDPGQFLEFAKSRGLTCLGSDFLPRALYGDYLRERLKLAAASAVPGIHHVHIRARVLRILATGQRPRWNLVLDDGREMPADRVVLATGNPSPTRLPQLAGIFGTPHYVHDPWNESEQSWSAPRVLLIGTSLTMADVALRLAQDASPPTSIRCLSRHGYVPLRQTTFSRSAAHPDAVAEIDAAGSSLRKLVRVIHRLGDETEARLGDWREIVALVRRKMPELWTRLDESRRRQFLRHVRPVWDIHRHRLPHQTLDALLRMRRSGRLETHAGSLVSAKVTGDDVEIEWRPRGESTTKKWSVDRVINCTGPDYRPNRTENPLLNWLLSEGIISPDCMSLGIRTTPRYEVVGADKKPVKGLYYIGPWLRARHWEATAVPELRAHAAQLAALL